MNHQQWLKWRKEGIGGSDAAVILKKFPFGKTPLMLYREKISKEEVENSNEAMEHGKNNEDLALDWFEKKMNCFLFRQIKVEHKEISWIRSTLDGLDIDESYMVEAKCPYNLKNHETVKISRAVPEIYYPQCQHQLKTTEKEGMYFLSFNTEDPDDSVILEVQRDNKFISEMLPEYEKFWNCVKNRIPPEMTELDFFCMEGDPYWIEASEKFKEAKEWAEKADYWRKELITYSEGRNCLGNGIKLTKQKSDGRFDMKSLMNDYPDIPWESYRRESFEKFTIRHI